MTGLETLEELKDFIEKELPIDEWKTSRAKDEYIKIAELMFNSGILGNDIGETLFQLYLSNVWEFSE